MPPTLKENGSLASSPEAATRSASPSASADASFKQQPVAVEVAVTVNGVRAVENGEKREPFSESTKTVLVFGSGAVIRLLASVVPGQLLFLTNEKTRKEVVCQVVKSKNYRNVSGYVELEFTEPAVGFWGMRFPGDRTVSATPAAPAIPAVNSSTSSGTPVAPRPAVPRVDPASLAASPRIPDAKPVIFAGVSKDSEPKPSVPQSVPPLSPVSVAPAVPKPPAPIVPISAKPEAPATPAMEKPIEPAFPILDPSRAADGRASIISAQTETPSLNLDLGEAKSSIATETKAAAPAAANPPKPTAASDPETEELKFHTARLQEELSSLLFKKPEPAKPAPVAPVLEKKELAETAAKVLEIAKLPHPVSAPIQAAEPAKTAPAPPKSTFGEDELQIPAWLEPLARNASAPASTEELIEREKAKRQTEFAKVEDIFAEPATQHPVAGHHEQSVSELRVPSFGSSLLLEERKNTSEARARKSGNGLFVGMIAAGIVLAAAAGAWYWRQQSGNLSAGMPAAQAQQSVLPVPAASSPSQSSAALPVNASAPSNAQLQNEAPAKSANNAPAGGAPTPAIEKHPLFNPRNLGAEPASSEPPAAEPKKPVLGDVRLASPRISKRKTTQDPGTADALALADDQPENTGGGLGAGLAVNNAQPAAPEAPLPVGGDVKQAKLLSTVPPVYPLLAKNQHVSGDVRIDALIDTTGHVTTMKVVSGPTLLHQAAKDALRQWKYQPATLDGKAVAMHLTVTIQFRLQ